MAQALANDDVNAAATALAQAAAQGPNALAAALALASATGNASALAQAVAQAVTKGGANATAVAQALALATGGGAAPAGPAPAGPGPAAPAANVSVSGVHHLGRLGRPPRAAARVVLQQDEGVGGCGGAHPARALLRAELLRMAHLRCVQCVMFSYACSSQCRVLQLAWCRHGLLWCTGDRSGVVALSRVRAQKSVDEDIAQHLHLYYGGYGHHRHHQVHQMLFVATCLAWFVIVCRLH